ncbi:IS4 family transposase [Fimbriiglobus ruber]|uniref:Transposase n=1 Tax=Fimbriiglobus ruber TaxID=1908690 RepID=A0A225DT28_9BACT|nr:IS4 family transposase [Fimbriiglobus ruber]OWK44481.1 transposase [Fimbriiglobus ruber]
MQISVANLASTLQTLFTATADRLARETQFVQRVWTITGGSFAQAVVFGWAHNPAATVDELAAALGVHPQSVHDRFNERGRAFLESLLAHAIDRALAATPILPRLLTTFTGAYAEDGTTVALPPDAADRRPGTTGNGPEVGAAAVKIFTRWERTTGAIDRLILSAGKPSDHPSARAIPDPPSGALVRADLGLFDTDRLTAWNAAGIAWISRVPTGITVTYDGRTQSLHTFLSGSSEDARDLAIELGANAVPCRLVVRRCPPAVVAQRLARVIETARRKQRAVSPAQRVMCEWTVHATDIPARVLNPVEVWMVSRARWQIELLFKGWKSVGGLAASKGTTGDRVECEILAKLIGQIVCQWGMLLRGGPLTGVNQTAARKQVQHHAMASRIAIAAAGDQLNLVITNLKKFMDRMGVPKRRRASTLKLLSRKHLTP